MPVTLSFNIAGKSDAPFGATGDPANSINGKTPTYGYPDTVPAGDSISTSAAAFDNKGNILLSYSSSPSNSNVLILTNGNKAPDGSTVTLADNQALMYFELVTTTATKMTYETVIVQVTITPL